jgi:stress response protein SCP2
VSLTKGRPVSLAKGQRVSLVKNGNQALTRVRMGLGWDPIKRGGGVFGKREAQIDLDAAAVLFAGGQPADVAFYNQLRSKDGSVQHMGDNRTGEGEGDDEVIVVDLTQVPPQVDCVMFVVTSYEGQTFEQVQNAYCRLVDAADGELARYQLAGGMAYTALAMAKIFRADVGWKLQALGEGLQARTPIEAAPLLTRWL